MGEPGRGLNPAGVRALGTGPWEGARERGPVQRLASQAGTVYLTHFSPGGGGVNLGLGGTLGLGLGVGHFLPTGGWGLVGVGERGGPPWGPVPWGCGNFGIIPSIFNPGRGRALGLTETAKFFPTGGLDWGIGVSGNPRGELAFSGGRGFPGGLGFKISTHPGGNIPLLGCGFFHTNLGRGFSPRARGGEPRGPPFWFCSSHFWGARNFFALKKGGPRGKPDIFPRKGHWAGDFGETRVYKGKRGPVEETPKARKG